METQFWKLYFAKKATYRLGAVGRTDARVDSGKSSISIVRSSQDTAYKTIDSSKNSNIRVSVFGERGGQIGGAA